MKERSFYSNLFFSLGLNLLVKPIAIFAIDAAVQNQVGHAYGIYFAFFNLSLILSIVFDLGINNYSTKIAAQNISVAKTHFSNVLWLRLLLILFYLLGLSSVKIFLTITWTDYKLILILGLNQFLIANISFFRSYFAGLQWFRLDAFFSILDRLLLIISMGYLLYLMPDGHQLVNIESYALFQFACYAFSFILAGAAVFYLIKPELHRVQISLLFPILKKSFPFALLIILMTLYTRLDALLLLHFSATNGQLEASYYAQSYRLIDALYMFAMIFAGLLFPMFAKLVQEDPSKISGLIQKASKLLLGSSLAFMVFSFFHGDLLLEQIYTHGYPQGGNLLFLLSIAFFGMASNLIYGSLLTANGSLNVLNRISFFGLLLNIILNSWLLPKLLTSGAITAATIAAFTQLLVAAAQAIYCKRLFGLPMLRPTYFRYLVLVLLLLFWYTLIWFSPLSLLSQRWLITSDVAVSLFLLLGLKFIDRKELAQLVQMRSKTQ